MKIVLAESLADLGSTEHITRWSEDNLMARLWAKDPTVWFDEPTAEIVDRLGWLDLPESSARHIPELSDLAQAARDDVHHIVLCGMGGSSLAPEVFAATLPSQSGSPELIVIDSTHPDSVARVAARIDIETTWFIIASKSGGTLETRSLMEFFWARASLVTEAPGEHFIAITDPGSELAELAHARGFRAVFLADPDVGGRYSALTHFGLVPAALIGADVTRLLESAASAMAMCGPQTPPRLNPAMEIGAAMAAGVSNGKAVTRFVGSGAGLRFGVWVEQLIAESTGKSGTGIVPVDGGPNRPGATDEVLVSVGNDVIENADISIQFSDPYDIGGAMFIMELATAIAGEILGIHPFNQPDVQRAKELANEAMAGSLPPSDSAVSVEDAQAVKSLHALLATGGLYVAIQAYVDATPALEESLGALRTAIAESTGLPTTLGFGPRFLHSTGQLHKGGPPRGLFVQLTDQPQHVIEVPLSGFTFNELIAGQATGDRQALVDADRAVVSIDLGQTTERGVRLLAEAVGDRQ